MKPKRIRPEGCDGKVRFRSFKAAEKVASKAAHRRHEQRCAYHCDRCNGYHIGESVEKRHRRKVRRHAIERARVRELEKEA